MYSKRFCCATASELCSFSLPMAFCRDGRVPELYEPGLRVRCGRAQSFAQGRVTVGSAQLDDVVVPTLCANALVLRQEATEWRLEAALDLHLEAMGRKWMLPRGETWLEGKGTWRCS